MKNNKRKKLRVLANFIICFAKYKDYHFLKEEEIYKNTTENVSLGGINFLSDIYFDIDTMLMVKLILPIENKYISFISKIVHIEKKDNSDSLFNIGIKFMKPPKYDLNILKLVLNKCKK